MGFNLNDLQTSEVDLSALANRLSDLRQNAIETKDFSGVDQLKSDLIAAGIEVRMSKSGIELVPGPNVSPEKLEALS